MLGALGDAIAGVLGNNQAVGRPGRAAGEAHRRADVAAAAGQGVPQAARQPRRRHAQHRRPVAGTITASLFLNEFTGDMPWAHIDMAGTMKMDGDEGWLAKGATGYGTRLLIDLVTNFAPLSSTRSRRDAAARSRGGELADGVRCLVAAGRRPTAVAVRAGAARRRRAIIASASSTARARRISSDWPAIDPLGVGLLQMLAAACAAGAATSGGIWRRTAMPPPAHVGHAEHDAAVERLAERAVHAGRQRQPERVGGLLEVELVAVGERVEPGDEPAQQPRRCRAEDAEPEQLDVRAAGVVADGFDDGIVPGHDDESRGEWCGEHANLRRSLARDGGASSPL